MASGYDDHGLGLACQWLTATGVAIELSEEHVGVHLVEHVLLGCFG